MSEIVWLLTILAFGGYQNHDITVRFKTEAECETAAKTVTINGQRQGIGDSIKCLPAKATKAGK